MSELKTLKDIPSYNSAVCLDCGHTRGEHQQDGEYGDDGYRADKCIRNNCPCGRVFGKEYRGHGQYVDELHLNIKYLQGLVHKSQLRLEAIKWAKYYSTIRGKEEFKINESILKHFQGQDINVKPLIYDFDLDMTVRFIIRFFNLSDEDLT